MFLQEKINDINKRLKALENLSDIVIWGAGVHTCKLFEKTALLSYNIKDIVDIDEKKHESSYFGYIIKSPDEIVWEAVDAVVISVPNKESQIKETLLNRGWINLKELLPYISIMNVLPFICFMMKRFLQYAI